MQPPHRRCTNNVSPSTPPRAVDFFCTTHSHKTAEPPYIQISGPVAFRSYCVVCGKHTILTRPQLWKGVHHQRALRNTYYSLLMTLGLRIPTHYPLLGQSVNKPQFVVSGTQKIVMRPQQHVRCILYGTHNVGPCAFTFSQHARPYNDISISRPFLHSWYAQSYKATTCSTLTKVQPTMCQGPPISTRTHIRLYTSLQYTSRASWYIKSLLC